MRCPRCGKDWPASVKFCGACGTKMARSVAPADRGLSAAQNKVSQELRGLLPQIGLSKFHEIEPGHHIGQRGSTHVDVRVIDFGGRVAVRSVAPVSIGSRLDQELLRFLLDKNAGFVFGAFGVDPNGVIVFSHTILASSMDAEELGASVKAVLLMADRFDDEIVRRWGGKTMAQTVIDKVLPARVLALLRRADTKV